VHAYIVPLIEQTDDDIETARFFLLYAWP
jgi:hypothetical protein